MARKTGKQDPIPALEWVAAGFGLVVVLLILGVLGWQAASVDNDQLPMLDPRVVSTTAAGRSHVVTVRVGNSSGRTAAAVHIEGVLGKDQPDEEISGATIDYVPGRGEAKAALVFATDPRGRQIDLRVTGYEHP